MHAQIINRFKDTLPGEITLAQKPPATLRALVGFLLRNIDWVVINVLVSLQQLLLSKALVTLVALKWFLVRVCQHVRFEVATGDGGVGAEVTLEAFFPLMGFLVNFQCVPIWEGFAALVAVHQLVTGMQFLYVQP